MTRLDATSEPSMEDILASIRRIIAEDPPGSRVAPTASPASQSQFPASQSAFRATDRYSPFDSRDTGAAAAPATPAAPSSEPYLKATPELSKTPYGSEPYFSSTPEASIPSSYASPNASPSRIEPSFGSISGPLPTADISPASKTSDLSVDAQLSELLGETATVSIKKPSPLTAPLRFGDRMAGLGIKAPTAENAPKPLEARPGFTVSRDGFVADTASAPPAAEPDPFDFDLGPSPFQTKPAEQAAAPAPAPAPTGNSLTARMSASALERISAPSVAATMPVADNTPSPAASEPEAVAAPEAPVAASEPVPPAEPEAEAPWAPIAQPSVAATIAPKSYGPVPAPEPVARFIPANASVEAPKQVEHDVIEVVAPNQNDMEVMRVAAEAETRYEPQHDASSSTALAVAAVDGQMRSMEDTVAELLRPMLKAWLAENMPRIVERALRREITEQMLGDQQAAAE